MFENSGVIQQSAEDKYPLNWIKVPNQFNTYIFFCKFSGKKEKVVFLFFWKDGATTTVMLSMDALSCLSLIYNAYNNGNEFFIAG